MQDRTSAPPPPPPPPPSQGGNPKPSRKAAPKDPAHRTPWRDNLEAAAMAILLALFLKAFLVEAYKIPSGSMQPTLMGMPSPGEVVIARGSERPPEVNDRILVDKLTPKLRDPKRWEVLVFRYPLKRTQNFVKRLVGMPGEQLRIAYGDILTRTEDDQSWSVERRPRRVQEAHWRPVTSASPKNPWRQTAGAGWSLDEDSIIASGSGTASWGDGGSILALYFDGYPESLRESLPARHPRNEELFPIGDLRLSGELRPDASCQSIVFTLSEGDRRYRFLIPGPSGDGRLVAEAGGPLRAGKVVEFEVENLDDRLTLRLDGEEVAALEIDSAADQQSRVTIDVVEGQVEFTELELERDIYYFAKRRTEYDIPEDHYLMLGDNTFNSSDGREWMAARFEPLDRPGEVVVGNRRAGGDNPSHTTRLPEVGAYFRFTDQWGVDHFYQDDLSRAPATPPDWLTRVRELPDEAAPFVERDLIVGRALAVFWPLAPHKGILRFKWVD
ncbi:MAG: signal peptidase I [Planctomycetota bacterium]